MKKWILLSIVFSLLFCSFLTKSKQNEARIDSSMNYCPNQTIALEPIEINNIAHTYGDCDIKGHNPRITVNVTILRDGSRVYARGNVRIRESIPDYSTFESSFNFEIFNLDRQAPDCSFAGIENSKGSVSADGGNNNHEQTRYYGTGVIKYVDCLSDTKGNDCGRLYCNIQLNDITIKLN